MQHILILLSSLLICFNLQAQSLLFEISDHGLKKPSYIFGTIHLTTKEALPTYSLAQQKLKLCKLYAMEIKMDDMNDASIFPKLMIPDGKSIKDFLSVQEYDSLSSVFFKATRMDLSRLDKIQPIFLAVLMKTGASQSINQEEQSLMMDIDLANQAKKNKQKIVGLETVDQQLASLSLIPIRSQALLLLEENNTESINVDQLYREQNIDEIYNTSTKEMSQELIKSLITDRNQRMAEKASELLQSKRVFIAVGAAHLGGDLGLLNLLKNKGYTIKPVLE